MISNILYNLKQTVLFKKLIEKENGENELSQKVERIVEYITPLLARIPEKMPEYTLHDVTHSLKVVNIMGQIIPPSTLDNLNILEITLLILSAYLHDIGMTCTSAEREEIIASCPEYKKQLKLDMNKLEEIEKYKNEGKHRIATFLEDQVFTEFLRKKHVQRSCEYIYREFVEGEYSLKIKDIPFYKQLALICNSHGEPVKSLYDTKKWPVSTIINNQEINIQYLSLILRLADILDLDCERTPKIIYEFVNPENPISIIEWKKHRSILGCKIGYDEVVYEAECNSPEVERALREFLEWIEIERKESIELLKKQKDIIPDYYKIEIPPISKERIYSDGTYIYSDLRFEIDYKRVINILMGERLYKNPTMAIRELIQNSVDAIKAREIVYKNRKEKFTPLIEISIKENELIIEDNGIGMDDDVFKNFFLQVGKSYYSSRDIKYLDGEIDSVSEFGIGILSTFMIAKSLKVDSRKETYDSLEVSLPIYYEIPTVYGFLIKRESKRRDIGTKIILELKDDYPFLKENLDKIITEIIPNSIYTIKINIEGNEIFISNPKCPKIDKLKYLSLSEKKELPLYEEGNYQYRYSKKYTNYLLCIDINKENDILLKGVEGKLFIVNTGVLNFKRCISGYVTQRLFKIGTPILDDNEFSIELAKNIEELFPCWTSFYVQLNFSAEAALTITPDRTDVIIDERYKELKAKIEYTIINQLKKHFDDFQYKYGMKEYYIYIDYLIENGFIGIDINSHSMTEDAKEFLSNYIYFPIIGFDGKINRKNIKELSQNKYIGIIQKCWNLKFFNEMVIYAKEENLNIIVLAEYNFDKYYSLEKFIRVLLINRKEVMFDSNKILLPNIYPIHIEIYDTQYYINIKENMDILHLRYDIVDNIQNYLQVDRQVLCVPGYNAGLVLRYNKAHDIMSILFKKNGKFKNKKAEEAYTVLNDLLTQEIKKSIRMINAKQGFVFSEKVATNNYLLITEGIFREDPNLFINLKNSIEKFWNKLYSDKLVKDSMPNITIGDFPWYWDKKIEMD